MLTEKFEEKKRIFINIAVFLFLRSRLKCINTHTILYANT